MNQERMSFGYHNKIPSGGGKKCGRWNPSSEQVRVLTELFKCGLRTPTTHQIREISNQLSVYGKIESKNVFYWFQNHKARERHKHRPKCDELSNKCLPSNKYLAEVKMVLEPEREIKTLELFPLNSFKESESKALNVMSSGTGENLSFAYAFGKEKTMKTDYPPLDLRLSFP